jgi:hypothetical protein
LLPARNRGQTIGEAGTEVRLGRVGQYWLAGSMILSIERTLMKASF